MSSGLDPTYGAMMIGLLFATFFQGVLSVQTYIYYESFPEDSWGKKMLVAGVWCLDTLHLVLIAQATYHYLVTNWGNQEALLYSTVPLDLHLVITGLATVACQSFFLRRIWVFSNKNKLLTGFLVAVCLTTLGLNVTISVQLIQIPSVTQFGALTPEVTAAVSIGAGVDIFIALLLVYYLRRGRSGFERTNSLISHVVQYTVATGLLTSMLALACLIAYFARPNTFIFIGMHFSLGRMYTNALLVTLNSRRTLRAVFDSRSAIKQRGRKRKSLDILAGSRNTAATSPYIAGNGTFALNADYKNVSPMSTSGMQTMLESPFHPTNPQGDSIELHAIGSNTEPFHEV